MSLKTTIDQDLKAAMLAGDRELTATLRNLKSAILYIEVAEGKREEGLTDDAIVAVLGKEAKKRQESADLYIQGGSQERADQELAEKKVIERYLPQQLSDEELDALVAKAAGSVGELSPQKMGQIIGIVRGQAGTKADGSRIAAAAKKLLESQ